MNREPENQLKLNVLTVGLALLAAIGWLRPTSQVGRYQIVGIPHKDGYSVVILDTASGATRKETTSYGAIGENRVVKPKRVTVPRDNTNDHGKSNKANSIEILAN